MFCWVCVCLFIKLPFMFYTIKQHTLFHKIPNVPSHNPQWLTIVHEYSKRTIMHTKQVPLRWKVNGSKSTRCVIASWLQENIISLWLRLLKASKEIDKTSVCCYHYIVSLLYPLAYAWIRIDKYSKTREYLGKERWLWDGNETLMCALDDILSLKSLLHHLLVCIFDSFPILKHV